jgi:choline dehydrogenase
MAAALFDEKYRIRKASVSTQQFPSGFTADFVVIGAGSAGAVIASRLTENGRYRVVLLEAGGEVHPLSRVPLSYAFFMKRPGVNWLYSSEPEASMGNRRIPVPRGRMLGGSSAINGNAWVRGNRWDYDQWRQLGNRGWGYDDLLPVFKSIESYQDGDANVRGHEGPIGVMTLSRKGRLFDSFFEAAESIGLKANDDHNGEDQEGVGMTQASIRRGRRMSTAECYLKPARGRKNLFIKTNATAQSLIIQQGRCIGVRYSTEAGIEDAFASREVILSAGVIASPQLLELSGIGAAQRLKDLGLGICRDLPGVGENLRDHLAPRMKWKVARHGVTLNEQARGLHSIWHGLSYIASGSGFLSMPAGALRGFFRTDSRFEVPDSMFVLQPMLATPNAMLAKQAGITIAAHQLRPESQGSVHISSTDPVQKPAIRFNFLSEQVDRDCVLKSVKIVRKLMEAPALNWLEAEEFMPGPSVMSDEELLAFVAQTAETAYHPVGTCKMGSDAMAVVDDQLQLRGLDGLRIADASIMPTLVSGNTNATSIMIGEKAARIVLDTAAA